MAARLIPPPALAAASCSRIGSDKGRRLAIHPAGQYWEESAVGDLRNKTAKLERNEDHRRKLARLHPFWGIGDIVKLIEEWEV